MGDWGKRMYCREIESFIKRFMIDGKIVNIPRRQIDRHAMRLFLAAQFDGDASYSEKEVNSILAEFYGDYAYLRRDLIDFGIMNRTETGELYRLSPDYAGQRDEER